MACGERPGGVAAWGRALPPDNTVACAHAGPALSPAPSSCRSIHQPASFAAAAAAAARTGDSSPAAAAAACGSHLQCLAAAVPGWLAHAQAWLQAASLLLVAVVWLHGTVVAALGVPLSPLLHVLVHGATVGALCWNAPSGGLPHVACMGPPGAAACGATALPMCTPRPHHTPPHARLHPTHTHTPAAVCRRYVSDHSSSAALVETLFTAMRHAVSVACLGTSAHLEAADEQATPAQKCVVVTCALEVRGPRGWPGAAGALEGRRAELGACCCPA